MKLRHLFLLIGIQVLTSSEVLQSQIQAQPSTKPMPTANLEDSLSLVKKKKVKVVSHDKTRIHHIKKVEPTIKKTIN